MTEEELQQRRERHAAGMRQLDARIEQMRANIEHMRIANDKVVKETR